MGVRKGRWWSEEVQSAIYLCRCSQVYCENKLAPNLTHHSTFMPPTSDAPRLWWEAILVLTWSEERGLQFTLSALTEYDDCVLWQTCEDVSEHCAAYVLKLLEKFIWHVRTYLPLRTISQSRRPSSFWGLRSSGMLRRVGWQLPTFRQKNISVLSSRVKQTMNSYWSACTFVFSVFITMNSYYFPNLT